MTALKQNHGVAQLAERQMRTWAMQLQTEERLARERAEQQVPRLIQPYLALSRESGVDGGQLAQRIAGKLNWRLFDGELLDYIAEHEHMSRLSLEFVDETAASWFHELFGKWLEKELVSQAEYVVRLGRVALLAAQHESALFVGRGLQFILPRESGVAVRIVAPKKQRVECVMARRQTNRRDAEKYVDDVDSGRAQFVERYFHHDVADTHLYDFVINLAHVSNDEAAEIVVDHCRRRFDLA